MSDHRSSMSKFRVRYAGLLLLTLAHAGFAADINDWSGVQSLRKGDRVGVIQVNQKRVEGRFESATDARITLQADQPITLEKSEVVRVYRPAKHSRVFGAGPRRSDRCGGGRHRRWDRRDSCFRNEGDSPAPGVITAVGGAAGAGIGAAVTGGYRTVYQRAK